MRFYIKAVYKVYGYGNSTMYVVKSKYGQLCAKYNPRSFVALPELIQYPNDGIATTKRYFIKRPK